MRKGIGSRTSNSHCEALLQQDHLPEQVEAGSAVELSLDLLDAVHGSLDAARAPVQGEAGDHGVEVSPQMEREASEPGQPAGFDCVDPGRERGAEAVGEYLAEVADMSGSRVQFRTTGQKVLEADAVLLTQGGGVAGWRVSQPVTGRTVAGRGGAADGSLRKVAMWARTMP